MFSYGFWLPHTALLLLNLACQGRTRRSWVSREEEGEPGCFTTKGQNHKCLPHQEKVLTRHRSCYCTDCILDEEDQYKNKEWVDDWKEVEIKREASPATTRQSTATSALDNDTMAHMADLAAKGSTVAIAAFEDPAYDFYPLKVTSNGMEELEEPMTDDYSCQYPSGSVVLKGHFSLRENLQDMTNTLDTKRLAVVYAGTVRAICTDLSVKKKNRNKPIYKLSMQQHEEIIGSM